MSDEQRSGMEPEAAASSRHFTEGTVPGPEPAEDTEGHARNLARAKEDEQASSEPGTETSDDDDTEGHRPFGYSDRNLKRDITPVSW